MDRKGLFVANMKSPAGIPGAHPRVKQPILAALKADKVLETAPPVSRKFGIQASAACMIRVWKANLVRQKSFGRFTKTR